MSVPPPAPPAAGRGGAAAGVRRRRASGSSESASSCVVGIGTVVVVGVTVPPVSVASWSPRPAGAARGGIARGAAGLREPACRGCRRPRSRSSSPRWRPRRRPFRSSTRARSPSRRRRARPRSRGPGRPRPASRARSGSCRASSSRRRAAGTTAAAAARRSTMSASSLAAFGGVGLVDVRERRVGVQADRVALVDVVGLGDRARARRAAGAPSGVAAVLVVAPAAALDQQHDEDEDDRERAQRDEAPTLIDVHAVPKVTKGSWPLAGITTPGQAFSSRGSMSHAPSAVSRRRATAPPWAESTADTAVDSAHWRGGSRDAAERSCRGRRDFRIEPPD